MNHCYHGNTRVDHLHVEGIVLNTDVHDIIKSSSDPGAVFVPYFYKGGDTSRQRDCPEGMARRWQS